MAIPYVTGELLWTFRRLKGSIVLSRKMRTLLVSVLLSLTQVVFSSDLLPVAKGPFGRTAAQQLQKRAARYYGTKIYQPVKLGEDLLIDFVLIPPGTLSQDGKEEGGSGPGEELAIERAFYVSKTDLSGLQLNAIVGKAVAPANAERVLLDLLDPNTLASLSTRLNESRGMRLASEVEWKYVTEATGTRSVAKKTPLHEQYPLKNGFGVLLPEPETDRGIRLVWEARTNVRGRFYCVAKGTAMIYLNGEKVSEQFHGGSGSHPNQVSPVLEVAEGDIVAVRFSSPYAFRSWRMVFVAANGKSYLPVGIRDIKDVTGRNVAELTPEMIHGETLTASDGRVADMLPPRWERLNVPSEGSDWIGGTDKNVWQTFAFVVKREMFKKASRRIRPAK
jgi:hypothetical protein